MHVINARVPRIANPMDGVVFSPEEKREIGELAVSLRGLPAEVLQSIKDSTAAFASTLAEAWLWTEPNGRAEEIRYAKHRTALMLFSAAREVLNS